ncbi:hypothetical protein D910_00292 [Dendroctonus ponderosae]
MRRGYQQRITQDMNGKKAPVKRLGGQDNGYCWAVMGGVGGERGWWMATESQAQFTAETHIQMHQVRKLLNIETI